MLTPTLCGKCPVSHNGASLIQQLQTVTVVDADRPFPADGQTVRGVVVVSLQGGDAAGSCRASKTRVKADP